MWRTGGTRSWNIRSAQRCGEVLRAVVYDCDRRMEG